MNKAELYMMMQRNGITDTREELITAARCLEIKMARLVDSLEADEYSTVNALGEVQSMGSRIDVLCGRLAALKESQKYIETLREEK